jgi:hypothetical protein
MQYCVTECNILSLTQVLTPLRCSACHMVLVISTLSLLSCDIPVTPRMSFEVSTYETSEFLESIPVLFEYEFKVEIFFRCRFICPFRDMYEVLALETLILRSEVGHCWGSVREIWSPSLSRSKMVFVLQHYKLQLQKWMC